MAKGVKDIPFVQIRTKNCSNLLVKGVSQAFGFSTKK